MRALSVIMSVVLGVGLISGCDREEGPTMEAQQAAERANDAQVIVDRTIAHLREGNLRAAEDNLRELERMRPRLPEHIQKQVDTLQAAVLALRPYAPKQPPVQPQVQPQPQYQYPSDSAQQSPQQQ